jgi:hypothetical protein
MTSIVGILCSDGVVIGCDSAATFGAGQAKIMQQPCNKMFLIDDTAIIAGTGEVGLNQRFCNLAFNGRNEPLNIFSIGKLDTAKNLAGRFIRDLQQSAAPLGRYGALVAWHNSTGFYLCEFGLDTFQPEFRDENIWYGSMGGGQYITDPFLGFIRRVFWRNGLPTVQQGTFAVAWTLDHVIKINPGGIDEPIRIGVVEKGSDGKYHSRQINGSEIDDHLRAAKEVEDYLSKFEQTFEPSDSTAHTPTI